MRALAGQLRGGAPEIRRGTGASAAGFPTGRIAALEHGQFPAIGSLVVAKKVDVAGGVGSLEVPMIRGQPLIEEGDQFDPTALKQDGARGLLPAVAGMALDVNGERFVLHAALQEGFHRMPNWAASYFASGAALRRRRCRLAR